MFECMLAIIEAAKHGLLQPTHWWRNILAGCVVGVVALPLAMAFAIAIGANPEQGIYTAIIAAVVVSVAGGCRVQIAGPTGAFIVVLAGIASQYGRTGLLVATMMAGVILVVMGVTKLGSLIRFIPVPVILGFTAGIAVLIFISQWHHFLGIPAIDAPYAHQKLLYLRSAIGNLSITTTAMGLAALGVLWLSPKVSLLRAIPGPLAILVLLTALQWWVQFDDVATIGSAFGGIPQGLPTFSLPAISWSLCMQLLGPAFAIALLGAIESLLSAVVADGMTGYRHNANQELIGQGIANMLVPLFGGFAATGALARTATNVRMGANSPLAGIVHSVVLLLVILLFAPLASFIPLTALAAILFVVSWNMAELGAVVRLIKTAPRADTVVLVVTFLLTVFADLVIAVNIGVLLSVLHFIRRMQQSVQVAVAPAQPDTDMPVPEGSYVISIEGPLFFGAIHQFDHAVSALGVQVNALVICMDRVPFIDASGLETLRKSVAEFTGRGIAIRFSGASSKVQRKLLKAHIATSAQCYPHLADALNDISNNKRWPDISGFLNTSKMYFGQ